MPEKAYFISDAHLGLGSHDDERAKEDRLIGFFEHIQHDAAQLFIVGDLFDTWFEYRTVIPKGFHRTLAALDNLVRRGITVHYLAGNHDYWMRDFFRDELGLKTYHQPFQAVIDGKRIYVHHGDGLANRDTGYRILKKILSNRASIWLYSWIHPDIGVPLARTSSRKSRVHTSAREYGTEDGMLTFSKRMIEQGIDVVVMGHRHQPVCTDIGPGQYVNLGDWIDHNTYGVFSGGKMELLRWHQ